MQARAERTLRKQGFLHMAAVRDSCNKTSVSAHGMGSVRDSCNKTAASAHGMGSGGLPVDAMVTVIGLGCLGMDSRGERFFVLGDFHDSVRDL